MKRLAAIIALFTISVAAASASAGPLTGIVEAPQFKIGVSTYDDVVKALGKPTSVYTFNGMTTIAYSSAHTHVKGMTFVPVVGMFAGGATASTAVTAFTFGADGLLMSTSGGATNIDCSGGVVSVSCGSGR